MKMFWALPALLLANVAFAACEFDIEVSDGLQYSVPTMEVESSCETVTVNLTHTGSLPKASMGHNWVLTTTADFQPVANAGIAAGLDNNYLPPDDARVIAYTEMIGGGESTSVSFSIADLEAGGDYTFFCSFPGHWAVMKGTFSII